MSSISVQFITIYLLIGGVLWLVSELIIGATRSAYLAQVEKGNSAGMCRAAGILTVAFIISCWPLVYGSVLIDTVKTLWRGEPI
jgi:hypothetical protein